MFILEEAIVGNGHKGLLREYRDTVSYINSDEFALDIGQRIGKHVAEALWQEAKSILKKALLSAGGVIGAGIGALVVRSFL